MWDTLLQLLGIIGTGALIPLGVALYSAATQRKIAAVTLAEQKTIEAAKLDAQVQGNAIVGLTSLADQRGDELDRQSQRIAQLETALHESQTEALSLKNQLQMAQEQTMRLQARMFDMQEKYDNDRRERDAYIKSLETRITQLETLLATRPRTTRKPKPENA